MFSNRNPSLTVQGLLAVLLLCAVWISTPLAAQAQIESVLYSFRSPEGGSPNGTLVRDAQGNLYGTTPIGGLFPSCFLGCGVVFKLAPDGTETMLYSFSGGADGSSPAAGLLLDANGNLYGTTFYGGAITSRCHFGCGVVFKLAPDGTETVLYTFTGNSDGGYPDAALIQDNQGNLYGTTVGGGAQFDSAGCGVVFRITPGGVENVLYTFKSCSIGYQRVSDLLRDTQGNLYGTTASGGTFGLGMVYELEPNGNLKVLHSFAGGSDGSSPLAGLVRDSQGNLFGTTAGGGGPYNFGTVFEVTSQGAENVLYRFSPANQANGLTPLGGLLRDQEGNLYGTTQAGGANSYGTVFELTPEGSETILYSFQAKPDAGGPQGTLLSDGAGNLYGTTFFGGAYNQGSVFKLTR